LDDAGLLEVFFTTVGIRADGMLPRSLPEPIRAQLARRAFSTHRARIQFHPWKELLRLAGRESIDHVCFDLDAHVAARCRQHPAGIRAVYCYEDVARDTFRLARERGWTNFYDLPIAYWETSQTLLREEAQRWPEWEPTLIGTRDSREKLDRKTEELELADVVLCPSNFVLESLPDAARLNKTCVVVEFGSPTVPISGVMETRQNAGGTLKILFAGSMTQRKGLADLFTAMKLLQDRDVELVVMGAPIAPMEFYRQQFAGFRYEAPRAHADVLDLMQSCDVLVLPSIVEGRALVQQEAMACGLPLIVTPNAGAEDLIDEGQTGFLVPIRSPENLAEKIEWFVDHRELLPEMRIAARAKAREYTWERYGEKIVNTVRTAMAREEVTA
ncbi:MAG TPA: glycosyltransferase family 4 protein, partial [Candidatus Limnocylindria bacterium]|nr:glycosyltransferase family 4 protein [Candidatus Limnocylindria bacterium]